MKLFFSEFKANYQKYHFPYQIWLLKEENDDVDEIYSHGFLPIRNLNNIYYLSRNLRVDLSKFELSSENRRVLNKTENIISGLENLSEFDYSFAVQKFCLDYSKKRFNNNLFGATAIKNIFAKGVYNHVFVFSEKSSSKIVGYAVCFISENILQYAHSFYDLDYFKESLGARMMIEAVSWAQKNNKKFAYLGTCYDESALYKTEFTGVEFFNGFGWSRNLEELKELLKINNKAEEYLLKDKEYLEKFYRGDISLILSNYGIRVNF